MPSKRYKVTMSDEERSYLQSLVTTGKVAAYKRLRAQILLRADQSEGQPAWTDNQISDAFDVGRVTVERTRKAFVLEGMESALNRKKQDRPSNLKFDGEKEAKLIAVRCSSPTEGRERWTLKLLADQLIELEIFESISPQAVGERLKNELKPWLKQQWCIPPKADVEFVCAMEDTLEVYHRPYDPKRPLVCMDEASKQQVKETADLVHTNAQFENIHVNFKDGMRSQKRFAFAATFTDKQRNILDNIIFIKISTELFKLFAEGVGNKNVFHQS